MTGTVRSIFKGPAGLRTGWAIAIFMVIASVVGGIIGYVEQWAIKRFDPAYWGRIAKVMHGAAHASVAFMLTNEVPLLLSYMAALAVMLRIERKRFTAFGLDTMGRRIATDALAE
jgi:hypothetical protein